MLTLCGYDKENNENDYLYDLNRTNYEGYEIYSSEDGKILKVYTKLTNIPHLYEK